MRKLVIALVTLAIVSRRICHTQSFDDEDEDIFRHFEKLLGNDDSEQAPEQKHEEPYPIETPSQPPPQPISQVDETADDDFDEDAYEKFISQTQNQDQEQQPATGQSTCECKKYFECNVAGDRDIGQESGNPPTDLPEVDVRLGDTLPSTCGHYLDICCDSVRENTTEIRNPEYEHTICGKRNPEGVGFRVKGAVNQESQFGEFPWMAAIVSPERQDGRATINVFVCGGSLIHPGVVLTAAHCVHKKTAQELIVRLGEWDTQTSEEIYPHNDHLVVKIVIHEDFYAGALYNDVALLFLKDETKIAPHIDTVCLPPANVNFDGQRCFASGWGRDSYGKEGRYQVILKKLELPIVKRDTCEYALKRTRLGRYFRLHDSFVCAGGEKADTCKGDGGSPLVCNVPGTQSYVQYGIVAWGIGCGEEGLPGVYVNVPKFVGWVTKKMAEARFNTRYFKLGRNAF